MKYFRKAKHPKGLSPLKQHQHKTWREKLDGFVNNKVAPFAGKIGNQIHLSALRDSFSSIIPLIIAGAFAVLIQSIVFGGAGSDKISLLALIAKAAHHNWNWDATNFKWPTQAFSLASQIGGLLFSYVNLATLGAISIYVAFALPYFLAISRKAKSPFLIGLTGIAAFMIAIMGQLTVFMDAKGLITAIIVGLASGELVIWLTKQKKLAIRMPQGVPPAVGKAFAAFLPMCITLAVVAIFNVFFLAPAIASTGWNVEGQEFGNATWKWGSDTMAGNVWLEAFQKWLKTAFPNNWNDIWNHVFNNQNQWQEMMNNWGHPGYDNNIFLNSLKGTMTKQGWGLFGLFLFVQHGGTLNHLGSLSNNYNNIIFTKINGVSNIILNIRYSQVLVNTDAFGFGAAIYKFFTSWFIGFAAGNGGLGLALLYIFMISLFWFFGIHGDNIMAGIFAPIWLMILSVNSILITQGNVSPYYSSGGQVGVFAKPFFDCFVEIGGTGLTLSLVIMTLIFSRNREMKEVGAYAAPAGLFNINEPVIFGFPIIFNFRFLIPFILGPIVPFFIAYFAIADLHIIKVPYIAVPWTTPFFISSFLATLSPWAPVVGIVCFASSCVIWFPFVLLDNKLHLQYLKKTNQEAYQKALKYAKDKDYRREIAKENRLQKKLDKAEIKALRAKEKAYKKRKK